MVARERGPRNEIKRKKLKRLAASATGVPLLLISYSMQVTSKNAQQNRGGYRNCVRYAIIGIYLIMSKGSEKLCTICVMEKYGIRLCRC